MMPYCTFFLGFLDIKPIKGGLEIDHGSSLIYIIPCSIIHVKKSLKNNLFFKEKKHYKHDAHDKLILTLFILFLYFTVVFASARRDKPG